MRASRVDAVWINPINLLHTPPATLTAVGAKTGMVDVNTGGMNLKMPVPSVAMTSLKTADKITLHGVSASAENTQPGSRVEGVVAPR